jgi:hypothetical protein
VAPASLAEGKRTRAAKAEVENPGWADRSRLMTGSLPTPPIRLTERSSRVITPSMRRSSPTAMSDPPASAPTGNSRSDPRRNPLPQRTTRDSAGSDCRILAIRKYARRPGGCRPTLSTAALPVAEQSGRAGAVTGVGVMRQRPVGRAGKRVIGHESPALRPPRASRALTMTSRNARIAGLSQMPIAERTLYAVPAGKARRKCPRLSGRCVESRG